MARSSGHIDRKVFEEDALTNVVSRGIDYSARHRNLVLGVGVGVVAVVVLGVLWARDARSKATLSTDSLSQVVLGYANSQFEPTLELANTVQATHAGTEAAILAQYFTGACQLRLGRFPEAEQSLRGYLANASKAPFYEQAARLALAATLSAQSRPAEAAAIYAEEAGKLKAPLATQVKLDAARAWAAAGSYDQAKPILDELAAGTDATARQAKIELAVMEARR